MADMNPDRQNFIDGRWDGGVAGRIAITNPAAREQIAEHVLANPADVDRAKQAARRLHLCGVLTTMGPIESGRMVLAVGREMLEHIPKPLWVVNVRVRVPSFAVSHCRAVIDRIHHSHPAPMFRRFLSRPWGNLRRIRGQGIENA